MFTKIAEMLSPSIRRKEGFTLIELLIVVAIIAILAAIAIPQFSAYRRRGYNASALSDNRNIRTTQEAMFADFQDYGASEPITAGPSATLDTGSEAATGGVAIRLVGGISSTTAQTVSLSPGVFGVTAVAPAALQHTSYLAKTGHNTGDQYYGSDSDTTSIYRKGYGTAGDYTLSGTVTSQAPITSQSGDQFTGQNNWVSM